MLGDYLCKFHFFCLWQAKVIHSFYKIIFFSDLKNITIRENVANTKKNQTPLNFHYPDPNPVTILVLFLEILIKCVSLWICGCKFTVIYKVKAPIEL